MTMMIFNTKYDGSNKMHLPELDLQQQALRQLLHQWHDHLDLQGKHLIHQFDCGSHHYRQPGKSLTGTISQNAPIESKVHQ